MRILFLSLFVALSAAAETTGASFEGVPGFVGWSTLPAANTPSAVRGGSWFGAIRLGPVVLGARTLRNELKLMPEPGRSCGGLIRTVTSAILRVELPAPRWIDLAVAMSVHFSESRGSGMMRGLVAKKLDRAVLAGATARAWVTPRLALLADGGLLPRRGAAWLEGASAFGAVHVLGIY